jgi:hypothetical protein
MVTKKTGEEIADEVDAPDPVEAAVEKARAHISNWEFLVEPPTTEAVLALLATLPPVHGLKHVDYADFVQALPAKKKIQKPHPTNPNLKVDEYIENWVLYMSVAGRQAMLNDAQALNHWRVEIEPEPNSPVGAPGFLSLEQRIVYREYIKIWQYVKPVSAPTDGAFVPGGEVCLGSRNGQAWVPFSGGSQAAGSNPYEKVETAARGRALGAWGFGVFPGSGIASLEEMLGVSENLDAIKAEGGNGRQARAENTNRPSREALEEKALSAVEKLRQLTSDTDEGVTAKVGIYVTNKLGSKTAYDPDRNLMHWDGMKDGQLMMLTTFLTEKISQIEGAL